MKEQIQNAFEDAKHEYELRAVEINRSQVRIVFDTGDVGQEDIEDSLYRWNRAIKTAHTADAGLDPEYFTPCSLKMK